MWGYIVGLVLLVSVAVFGGAGLAMAQTSSSDNYQVSDMEFGSGGTLESCSGQYCTQASIGSLLTGSSESGGRTATFGPIAEEGEPSLEVIITDGESNLGVLRTDRPATKTVSVQVRNYLSYGYFLQIIGDPPEYNGHKLATPSEPTVSQPGTEQFAINVVKNTEPEVGADPVQVPSGEFSFGYIKPNYNVPNEFMYTNGATVAQSDAESGQTNYTISMIINVSDKTPAGHYAGNFSALVIPAI